MDNRTLEDVPVLTQESLDKMCDEGSALLSPGSTAFLLSSECHPDGSVFALYFKGGELKIICPECRSPIATIKVAKASFEDQDLHTLIQMM